MDDDFLVPHSVGAIVFVSLVFLSSIVIWCGLGRQRAPSENKIVAILLEAQGILIVLPLLLFWPTVEVVNSLTKLEATIHTVVDYPSIVVDDIKQTSFDSALCEEVRLKVLNETEQYKVPNYTKFDYDYDIAYAGSGALLGLTILYVILKRYRTCGVSVVSSLCGWCLLCWASLS